MIFHTSDSHGNQEFKFTFEAMNPFADDQGEYAPSSSTDSPETWELINRWKNQCTDKHERCNASRPESWAPSRLLDVGTFGDPAIRLVERGDSVFHRQSYATLSHCWGMTPIITTEKATVAKHQKGIDISDLPRTFQEAVSITRRLLLRYLWIDSLCIVQDSIEDWAHEADLMSKVYRYAFINIAATGAENSSVGCFSKRNPAKVRPTETNIRWYDQEGGTITEPRRYQVMPDTHIWAEKLLNEPLNQRGWVLQERILAPRILHFGSEQLFWEYREVVACETYHRGLPPSLRDNRAVDIKTLDLGDEPRDERWPAKYVSRSMSASTTLIGQIWNIMTRPLRPVIIQEVTLKSAMKNSSLYRDWNAVVQLYSQGALTIPTDKLVALSGLASTVMTGERNLENEGYLAGLWHSSLPAHLLWTTEVIERKWGGRREIIMPRRYNDYIAPSWSWASIESGISLTWCEPNYDPKDYLATLEHAEVEWATGARFGQVKSGYLRISGPVASILWEHDQLVTRISQIFPKVLVVTELYGWEHQTPNVRSRSIHRTMISRKYSRSYLFSALREELPTKTKL